MVRLLLLCTDTNNVQYSQCTLFTLRRIFRKLDPRLDFTWSLAILGCWLLLRNRLYCDRTAGDEPHNFRPGTIMVTTHLPFATRPLPLPSEAFRAPLDPAIIMSGLRGSLSMATTSLKP